MITKGEDLKAPARAFLSISTVLMPAVLGLYSLTVPDTFISSALALPVFKWVFLCVWLLFSLYFYLGDSNNIPSRLVRTNFNLWLLCFYTIAFSGFAPIILAFWILLLVDSFVHGSVKNLKLSLSIVTIALVTTLAMGFLRKDVNVISLIVKAIFDIASIILPSITIIYYFSQKQNERLLAQEKEVKQTKLERERALTIINNMTDAVIGINKKGIIEIFNASALNLLNTNSDLKGKLLTDVIKPRVENRSFNLLNKILSAKAATRRDDLSIKVDDQTVLLSVTYAPIREPNSKSADQKRGSIIMLRDITKEKTLEEEKDEFISVVSHELRTPITITEGTISNLQALLEVGRFNKKQYSKVLDSAHEQVVYLASIINDLSTLSRAERGIGHNYENICPKNLMEKLYNKYLPEAEKRGLALNLDVSAKVLPINTSRLYLEELLQNFITNSLRYTKEGGITLIAHQGGEFVTLGVKDTGIGISKQDQAKIFDKFYRAEDYRTRETSGSGLGLYVAKKLAGIIQTKIEVTSRLNHGSVFSITLPAVKKDSSLGHDIYDGKE